MELKLKPSQFNTLSNFFNDVAKGLVLAAILGQGTLTNFSGLVRILISLFWIMSALFLLYFAVLFSREAKS